MTEALARALAQLLDPAIRWVLVKTILGTLLILALLWMGAAYALAHLGLGHAWLSWTVLVLGHLATGFLAWLLFPGVSGLVMSFMLDDVAAAVERRHYPWLGTAPGLPLRVLAWAGLRFAVLSVVLNLIALPLYLFVPGINLLFFYGLNGYLLSREYFELVAFRRVGPREARRQRLAHPAQMLIAGAIIALLLTVPVVNLVAPVFATALMVHLFQGYVGPSQAAGWVNAGEDGAAID